MIKPIIAHGQTLGVDAYQGTNEENETLVHALRSFGFLLRPKDLSVCRVSFAEFANAIEANYSLDDPRNNEVVLTLRALHARNC